MLWSFSALLLLNAQYDKFSILQAEADLGRFPPLSVVQDALDFNYKYRQHIAAAMALYPYHFEELQVVMQHAERLRDLWDHLDWAILLDNHPYLRLENLDFIREQIGLENYYRGIMPAPVPLWSFREVP